MQKFMHYGVAIIQYVVAALLIVCAVALPMAASQRWRELAEYNQYMAASCRPRIHIWMGTTLQCCLSQMDVRDIGISKCCFLYPYPLWSVIVAILPASIAITLVISAVTKTTKTALPPSEAAIKRGRKIRNFMQYSVAMLLIICAVVVPAAASQVWRLAADRSQQMIWIGYRAYYHCHLFFLQCCRRQTGCCDVGIYRCCSLFPYPRWSLVIAALLAVSAIALIIGTATSILPPEPNPEAHKE